MNDTSAKIEAARARLVQALKDAALDASGEPPSVFAPPYSAGVGYYDGVFMAVTDAAGRRLVDLRDIEGAAALVHALNAGGSIVAAMESEIARLREALESVRQYGVDTRVETLNAQRSNSDVRTWQRAALQAGADSSRLSVGCK